MTTKQNCTQCKRLLDPNVFFYNDKNHTTCFSCSKKRINKQNICEVCGIRARYNYSEKIFGISCKKHSKPDMVDIKNPKCIVCKKTRPSYNYQGETKATHCKACSLPDMVDIKHPKCIVCKKRANYGIPCNSPIMCYLHKKEEMIKGPNSYCRKKDCKNKAIYGIKLPIHCESHKVDNDINLVERKCSNCGVIDVLINGLCVNICVNMNIDNIYKKNQKVKEKRVLKILSSEIGIPTSYNERVDWNCGGKNSEEKEIVYDCGTHQIHIEVDENKHKNYCKLGEVNRMRNIYHNEGGIPILFIRYNPDSFIGIDGKKVNLSQARREELLIKWVKYYMENKPEYFLSVKYLFYDGHSDGRDKYYNIDPLSTFNEYCVCGKEFCIEGCYNDHIEECEEFLKINN